MSIDIFYIVNKQCLAVKSNWELFMMVNTWKQPKYPSTEEWIKKMWYMYIMEYYSAIKRNEIMPFAATWMGSEMSH